MLLSDVEKHLRLAREQRGDDDVLKEMQETLMSRNSELEAKNAELASLKRTNAAIKGVVWSWIFRAITGGSGRRSHMLRVVRQ